MGILEPPEEYPDGTPRESGVHPGGVLPWRPFESLSLSILLRVSAHGRLMHGTSADTGRPPCAAVSAEGVPLRCARGLLLPQARGPSRPPMVCTPHSPLLSQPRRWRSLWTSSSSQAREGTHAHRSTARCARRQLHRSLWGSATLRWPVHAALRACLHPRPAVPCFCAAGVAFDRAGRRLGRGGGCGAAWHSTSLNAASPPHSSASHALIAPAPPP